MEDGMFIHLLLVNLLVALAVCVILALLFRNPIAAILRRIIAEDIHRVWGRYLTFAIYVVGLSGGVRVWDLERYINPSGSDKTVLQLTQDRWVLEVYRTIIGTLQSVAWMLLVFFLFAMIAYVIIKGMEVKRQAAF
jgi:hypothetical protein